MEKAFFTFRWILSLASNNHVAFLSYLPRERKNSWDNLNDAHF